MANERYMRLTSNDASDTGLVLVNGATDTGYDWKGEGLTAGAFGAPSWESLFATPMQGSPIRVGRREELREFDLTFKLDNATVSTLGDEIETLLRQVQRVNDSGGGRLRYRPEGFSNAVEFDVLNIDIDGDIWGERPETLKRQNITLVFTCTAWAYPDPMYVIDEFDVDTFGTAGKYNNGGADWTLAPGGTGALANIPISGSRIDGSLNLTTANQILHTGSPHTYRDPVAAIGMYVGTTTNFKTGVILKWVDVNNYIEAYIDYSAGHRLRVDVVLAGVRTNRASSATGGTVTNLIIGLLAMMNGPNIYAAESSAMTLGEMHPLQIEAGTGWASASYSLSAAEAAVFDGVLSRVGITFTPAHTDSSITWFEGSEGALSPKSLAPFQSRLSGTIAAPCDFDLAAYYTGSGGPTFEQIAWWNRARNYSFLQEQPGQLGVSGRWTNAAVAGVQTNAGTALSNSWTPDPAGIVAGILIGASAVTDAGGNVFLGRLFRKGRTYRATGRVLLGSGSASVRAKFGVSGDITTGSAVALSSSYQTITADWTPAADTYGAYFAATCNASATYTGSLSTVQVYELCTQDAAPVAEQGGLLPFGMLAAQGYLTKGAGLTATGTSGFASQPVMQGTGATSGTSWLTYGLVTHPLDEPGGYVDVDYYGLVQIQSTVTGCTLGLRLVADPTSTTYKTQYAYPQTSSSPKAIAAPSSGTKFRMVYLGRLRIPADGSDDQHFLQAEFTTTGGGTYALDYLWGVPVAGGKATATAIDSSTVPTHYGSSLVRLIKSAGQRFIRLPGGRGRKRPVNEPVGGLGGPPLRLQSGARAEACFIASTAAIPDDTLTSASDATVSLSPLLWMRIRPKHFIARS